MNVSKTFIVIGLILVAIGLLWPIIQKFNLGRLPGDIAVERDNVRFYFPLTTSIIISVLVSLLFWFFRNK